MPRNTIITKEPVILEGFQAVLKPSKFDSMKILNMKENRGHAALISEYFFLTFSSSQNAKRKKIIIINNAVQSKAFVKSILYNRIVLIQENSYC